MIQLFDGIPTSFLSPALKVSKDYCLSKDKMSFKIIENLKYCKILSTGWEVKIEIVANGTKREKTEAVYNKVL